MSLTKVSGVGIDGLTVSTSGRTGKTYINYEKQKCNFQSPFVTLDQHSLPNKKYLKAQDSSISLTVPIKLGDELYNFFSMVDSFLTENVVYKPLHKFIICKNGEYSVRFKLYGTTLLFLGKEELPIKNIMSFYDVLVPGSKIRVVFSFSHSWEFNNTVGFSASVIRVQIDETTFNKSILDDVQFAE